MKEAQRHRIACQHPMRAGIVERQERLRAVAIHDVADAAMNAVERLIPGDLLELARAFRTNALERVLQAILAVDEVGIVTGHLGANGTMRNGIGFRTPHADNLIACNRH